MISAQKISYIRRFENAQGHISPQALVEDARRPDSPLFDEFEWDVAKAAEAHWLDRAQQLIRFVKLEVTIRHDVVKAPYYARDPTSPPRSHRYIALPVAASQRATAQRILADELDRIIAAIRRAQQVAAVLGLTDQLDELLSDVNQLQTQAEQAAEEKKKKKRSSSRTTRRRRRGDEERPRPRA